MAEDIPAWKRNKNEYNKRYMAENSRRINISLNTNTDQEYIEIYEQIPNKREWFKEALLEYKKKNLG